MKVPLVIWMVGYPLAKDVGRLLNAKARRLEGKTPHTDSALAINELFWLVFWVVGIWILY